MANTPAFDLDAFGNTPMNCMTLIAGKAASATGHVLVGHNEAERVELHAGTDERVRADDELDAPIGQPGEHRAALRRGHGAGEQRDRNAERREQT